MFSIGLMSGTSMDGIDAALIETDGTPRLLRPIAHTSLAYTPIGRLLFKSAEFAVRLYDGDEKQAALHFSESLDRFFEQALALPKSEWQTQREAMSAALNSELNSDLSADLSYQRILNLSTQYHIKAVKQLLNEQKLTSADIDIIGYHGQCLYHQPNRGISVIVGDGQTMANALGIRVVNDFRRNDIEQGGQGAPFAPLYHQALAIRDKRLPLCVVNCGGISNVTFVMGDNESDLMAFDTGPGNALMDQLMRQRTKGELHYDKDGYNGLQGKVDETVLSQLLATAVQKDNQNYSKIPPPKSLDYGDMTLIPELAALSLPDACRTLAAFTAETIVNSIDWLTQSPPHQWVLAGGGWENPVILSEFTSRLTKRLVGMCDKPSHTPVVGMGDKSSHVPEIAIQKAEVIGWENQALEAQIFAYFGVRRLHDLPLSLPKTTGVRVPVTGGIIWHPT